jgi:hypothetical protein
LVEVVSLNLSKTCSSDPLLLEEVGDLNSLVNTPIPPPAPNPEEASSISHETLRGFPPPAHPDADIGDRDAAQRAINIAATRFGECNPRVIKNSVMSYREAFRLGAEPLDSEDDPLASTPVRVVEILGTFKRRRGRPRQAESSPTFTKGYIILRAADGLPLAYFLTNLQARPICKLKMLHQSYCYRKQSTQFD